MFGIDLPTIIALPLGLALMGFGFISTGLMLSYILWGSFGASVSTMFTFRLRVVVSLFCYFTLVGDPDWFLVGSRSVGSREII
jgi:hypothetical protein